MHDKQNTIASTRPRVALVRGPGLASTEMQSYEPLLNRYALHAFCVAPHACDLNLTKIPYEMLHWPDTIGGRSLSNAYRSRLKGERYYMPGLEKKLKGFAIVHSTEIHTTFSWQVVRARKKLGYRVVITSTENIPFPAWDRPLIARRKQEVLENTDLFLALTPDARDVLAAENVPLSRVRVVPYALDLQRFRPGNPAATWVTRTGIRLNDFVILFVGRLVWEKGIFDLLNAVRMMNSENLRVIFVGDGPERQSLKQYANLLNLESVISIASAVPYSEIEKVYQLADVLALPSIPTRGVREQFGLVLIEAMACGKPVVASRCGSMPGIIQDAGLLTNPGDANSLAQALNQLRHSPDMRQRLGQRGRAVAEQNYDRNKVAEQIHEAYQCVLSS